MTVTFADVDLTPEELATIRPDVTPDVSDVEYPCVVCNKEAGPYGGRGRKPTRCPEHKKTTNVSGSRSPRVTGTNAVLAAQATEALCSIDGIMQLGCAVIGMTETAAIIAEADEVFRLRVNAALLNSPDTARKILRYGGKAGDAGLLIAILLHVATIAPVFVGEVKTKKAAKQAEQERAELENNR